jgi:rod shape-determining protein MreC
VSLDDHHRRDRRARTVLVLLLLASFAVITLDAQRADDTPVDAMRTAAGAVFGPLETAAATVATPVTGVTGYFGDVADLRAQNRRLEARSERLRSRLRTTEFVRNRRAQVDRLLATARGQDRQVVAAQVTALGGAQSFSRTVTIDAGRRDGVRPDMTVLNGDGLVGRVVAASPTTATVLLVIDPDSVVGGRVGRNMELGFVSGEGDIGDRGRMRMQLVDRVADPARGDTVLTWGSRNGAPYVAGVPIGSVTEVLTSPRELSKTVVIEPYVDFSSLDVVGVVVGHDARDRVEASRGGEAR